VVDVSAGTDYDTFTGGSLMFGPVLKGFETQLIDDGEDEVDVDMPGAETAQFTIDGAIFAYGPDTDGTEIEVTTGTDTKETVLLDFVDVNGPYTIYKHTVFSGMTSDMNEFHCSFTGYGYLHGDLDGDPLTTDTTTMKAKVLGEIVKNDSHFAILILAMDAIDMGDIDPHVTPLSLDPADFSGITPVADYILYHYDKANNTYNSGNYTDVNVLNPILNGIESGWGSL
jgi:hypothetical protein